jgi:hypothetical protein
MAATVTTVGMAMILIIDQKSTLLLRSIILIASLLVIASCKNGMVNDVTDPVEDVSYTADIQSIFNGTCAGAGCHIGSSQSGVNLSSYDQVMNSTGHLYEREIVQAGEPGDSPLVDKIEPNPQHGERMPFGRDPLNNRQIQEIRVWIEEGARDN